MRSDLEYGITVTKVVSPLSNRTRRFSDSDFLGGGNPTGPPQCESYAVSVIY